MANRHETTFGNLETDERFKRLQRSLKLAALRQESGKNARDEEASIAKAWPSVSSINANSSDFSAAVSLQTASPRSEVLASSNNLRNILLRKRSHDTGQKTMTTSSVKRYPVKQDDHVDRLAMPPPAKNTVYRACRESQDRVIRASSDCEKRIASPLHGSAQSSSVSASFLKSAPTWIFTNTDAGKNTSVVTPTNPIHNFQNIDRVFSKWKVVLNDQYELVIKGTLDNGRIARSKPVIRRYSARCVESKYKNIYILEGNIVDERNGLPDYIYGKFYNGFPDDWENVYQIWRMYVSQGCRITFRWPTPITDCDDDLKSELTDLTDYIYVKQKKTASATASCNLNEYSKSENLNNTYKEKEECNNSTHGSQNYERNTSFIKPFISKPKKDIIPVVQAKNTRSLYDGNNQSVKSDINSPPGKVNKLKDVFQEDKLNIIINNLADRNCSPKYIDKILEMFDCLDYVISYRTESKCNNDSVVSASDEISRSEIIPVQQRSVYNDNPADTDKFKNNLTELKSCTIGHSTDLGYGSIKSYSNAIQLSNPTNLIPENDKDSDKSEGETYGVPKISIERVLKARETSGEIYKRKVRKKTIYLDNQKHAMKNKEKRSQSDKSCVSITEDEMETASNTRECRKTVDISRRPLEMTFANHREIQRNNIEVHGKGESVMHVQNEQPFNAFEVQRVNLNVFTKEQKVPCKIQNNARSRSVTDVDYTISSDVDVISSSTRKNTGENIIASHNVQNEQPFSALETQRVNLGVFKKEQKVSCRIQDNARLQFVTDVDYTTSSDVDVISSSIQKIGENIIKPSQAKVKQDIVITNKDNGNFSEKPSASLKLHREFIEQTKSEIAVKQSKPSIISSIPVNFKLRLNRIDSNAIAGQLPSDKIIMKNEDKQTANIRPFEKTDEKSMSKTSIAAKPVINDSYSKTTIDNKKETHPVITNIDSHDTNPTNTMTNPTKQSESIKSLGVKNLKMLIAWMPKVVYYAKSKYELGLIFQGKLVNEVGHVVHRKYTTDIVLKRLSSTLIETVNHEFYKLLGDLNDNKHIIPKELLKQCRNGCPARIEQFCLTWKTLQHDNIQEIKEKLHDATIDSLNAPVSSRGRRILPPLCYWAGERITLKDNNPVYDPGNTQESSLLLLPDNSREIQNNTMERKKERKVNSESSSKKQSVNKRTLPDSNKISGTNKNQDIIIEKSPTFKKSPKIKDADSSRKSGNSKKFPKSINNKRQLSKRLTSSSSNDVSEEEQKASPRKRVRNFETNENADPESQYTMTLRKRQKTAKETYILPTKATIKTRYYTAYHSPTKTSKNRKLMYDYCQVVSQSEDFLSENEVS